MNHNIPGGTSSESWPKSDQDDHNTSRGRRRRKRSNKQKRRANASASVESAAIIESDGSREYSADKLREAVIWVRDIDSLDKNTKPLIDTSRTIDEGLQQTSERSESRNAVDQSESTPAPAVEQVEIRQPIQVEPVHEAQRSHYEPSRQQARTYFWNQPEVSRSDDRDALPAVSDQESVNDQDVTKPATNTIASSGPTLEMAVNPNTPTNNAAFESAHEAVSPEQAAISEPNKADFASRRQTGRAVQSQSMEGEAFDRTMPVRPLTEVDTTAASYAELPVDDEYNSENLPAGPAQAEPLNIPSQATVEYASGAFAERSAATSAFESYFPATERNPEQAGVDHSLERSELLDLSRSIRIDGVSVYEMFTAKRIDEAGLRRIVTEYLRGGELRDVITSEVIRQQLKFERDPQLRDTPVNKTAAGTTMRTVSNIKQRTKSLVDPERRRDRTERLAEFTQSTLEKSHELLNDKSNAARTISIGAIVVIYLTILIVILVK